MFRETVRNALVILAIIVGLGWAITSIMKPAAKGACRLNKELLESGRLIPCPF